MALIHFEFESQFTGHNEDVYIVMPDKKRSETPEEFYGNGKKYPVLWLLHGTFGGYSDWIRKSNLETYACEHDCIVVMMGVGNADYEAWPAFTLGYDATRYVTEELMPMVYNWLPASSKREDNFISGLSMGGGGTGKISINYPENYAAALIMSSGGGLNDPRPGQALRPCPRGIPRDRKISGTWPSKTSSPAKRYRNTSSPAAAMTSPWKALNSPVIS